MYVYIMFISGMIMVKSECWNCADLKNKNDGFY